MHRRKTHTLVENNDYARCVALVSVFLPLFTQTKTFPVKLTLVENVDYARCVALTSVFLPQFTSTKSSPVNAHLLKI